MRKPILRLAIAVGAVGLVWFVILPWVANRPVMAAHIQWLEEEKVDPSAMYYTELEMMEPILTRLALDRRKNGEP